MGESDPKGDRSSGRRIKVVRLIEAYGLDGIGAEMERRWTTAGDEHMSLRSLADYFNRELLDEALSAAGTKPLSSDVTNIYETLTDESGSSADRTRIERRLEREGIDVASLRADFVSYQAIRTYLKEYRNAEQTTDDRDRREIEAEHIKKLRGRVASVTESKLEQLSNGGDIALGDARLFLDINVFCDDCKAQYGVEELLDRGGCDCSVPADE